MKSTTVSPEVSVAESLASSPHAEAVLNRRRTACVGCYLARFCTLKDVATTYGLPLEAFLAEMDPDMLNDFSLPKGAQHEEPH